MYVLFCFILSNMLVAHVVLGGVLLGLDCVLVVLDCMLVIGPSSGSDVYMFTYVRPDARTSLPVYNAIHVHYCSRCTRCIVLGISS
jgi:hypothetical protein